MSEPVDDREAREVPTPPVRPADAPTRPRWVAAIAVAAAVLVVALLVLLHLAGAVGPGAH